MRLFFLCISLLTAFLSCREKPAPVAIILDTDIAPDYDDVGALAMLHAYADKGEADILATISCNAFNTTTPALSVINTYFKRPKIPIGIVKASKPFLDCRQKWAEAIIEKYPHSIHSNEEAEEAVKLYRKILSQQPDTSVTIVTIGMFTNVANLLESPRDEYSPLDGRQLILKKVKQLVAMAASIDSAGCCGYEFNVTCDISAAQKVFANWPSPITISPLEIGINILTGVKLINNEAIQDSPIKEAYRVALAYDSSKIGRCSWDQTAVLVAVKGIEPYFNCRKLNFVIKNDGKDSVIAGDRINYLTKKEEPEALSKIIEELMMHQPSKK